MFSLKTRLPRVQVRTYSYVGDLIAALTRYVIVEASRDVLCRPQNYFPVKNRSYSVDGNAVLTYAVGTAVGLKYVDRLGCETQVTTTAGELLGLCFWSFRKATDLDPVCSHDVFVERLKTLFVDACECHFFGSAFKCGDELVREVNTTLRIADVRSWYVCTN